MLSFWIQKRMLSKADHGGTLLSLQIRRHFCIASLLSKSLFWHSICFSKVCRKTEEYCASLTVWSSWDTLVCSTDVRLQWSASKATLKQRQYINRHHRKIDWITQSFTVAYVFKNLNKFHFKMIECRLYNDYGIKRS